MTAKPDLPINDAVPAPTKIEPGNLFLWNWRQMQVYAQACVAHATAAKDAEIEALREEIGRLLDSREREGDRLDWLLARLPRDVIRDLVGEMSCTSDVGEWRDRIDKAARFKPPNP